MQTNKKLINMLPNNFLLTEHDGNTGGYWLHVVAVQTKWSEVDTKTTKGQYFSVQLEQAIGRLESSLLYGTRQLSQRKSAQLTPNSDHKRTNQNIWILLKTISP